MSLFTTLPGEIESYILWLSAGANNIDIYNKKKEINTEINFFKSLRKKNEPEGGVYLKPLRCYSKTPELQTLEYNFGSRYLLADYGITKQNHNSFVLISKEKNYLSKCLLLCELCD